MARLSTMAGGSDRCDSLAPKNVQSAMNDQEKEEATNKWSVALSPELKAFYGRHNLHGVVEELLVGDFQPPLRFLRLNPRHDKAETLALLEKELPDGSTATPIPWLDERFGFYAVPGHFSIAESKSFRSGRVYGMDVSSGAAVQALLLGNHDGSSGSNNLRVLDLCCSPGLKLCMMADVLSARSTIVGVDISERRLSLCKSIVKKYHVDPKTSGRRTRADNEEESSGASIRLYCADGTKFGTELGESKLMFDSDVAVEESKLAGRRKRPNKSARARETKRLRQLAAQDKRSATLADNLSTAEASSITIEPFDCVLVDSECSTDGSLKHVQHRLLKTASYVRVADSDDHQQKVANIPTLTDPKQLESLVELQKGLLASGFGRLKHGGVLVYSTCSLSLEQNEHVVNWLLEHHEDSFVIPVSFDLAEDSRVVEGSVKGTVRLLPATGRDNDSASCLYGGGFFLARIGKRRVG